MVNTLKKILTSVVYRRNSFLLPATGKDLHSLIEFNTNKSKFVLIGVNDGKDTDLLLQTLVEKQYKGLLIEPNFEKFHSLHKTFNSLNYEFFNIAISSNSGILKLYKLSFTNEPWATGLITSNKDLLLSHFSSNYIQSKFKKTVFNAPYDQYIEEFQIECLLLDEFVSENDLNEISFLIIDTEGHEFDILKSFSFKVLPKYIYYESCHFDSFDKYFAICKKLRQIKYDLFTDGHDILAILKSN